MIITETNDNPVLTTSMYVVENSEHVSIDKEAIQQFVEKLLQPNLFKNPGFQFNNWRDQELHPKLEENQYVGWIFFVSLLNFSFWDDRPLKFQIRFNNIIYTGYRAFLALMNNSLNENKKVYDFEFWNSLSDEQLTKFFTDKNGTHIPLLKERVIVVREACHVLKNKFNSNILEILKIADNRALVIIDLLTSNFKSFDDFAIYKNKTIKFNKRAQIFVAEIWACFNAEFKDIEKITMFADYRVPQALCSLNILKYSSSLLENLHLKNKEQKEVEIRANSVIAVHLIVKEIIKRKQLSNNLPNENNSPLEWNNIIVDFYLWEFAKHYQNDIIHSPVHKTRCIYY